MTISTANTSRVNTSVVNTLYRAAHHTSGDGVTAHTATTGSRR